MRHQRAELVNDVVQDLCQSQSIKHTTTASYPPHQNGLVEKGHVVVDRVLEIYLPHLEEAGHREMKLISIVLPFWRQPLN